MSAPDPKLNPIGKPLIAEIKDASNILASLIEKLTPGRRRSVALTYLETAAMYAVKAADIGDT